MRWAIPVCWMLLGFAVTASNPKTWFMDQKGELTLPIVPEPASNEMAVLEVKIGPIPRDARIVVRSMDKKVLGVIAPYGKLPNARPSVFSVPVPKKLLNDKHVTLFLEVTEKGSKTARPPKQSEIEDVKLRYLKTSERRASQ